MDSYSTRHLSVSERFYTSVDKTSDCWSWQGKIAASGYGRFQIRNRWYQAHRVAFEMASGEIPDGYQLLHSCDNRRCVNPAHLSIGTCLDNSTDKRSKGRGVDFRGENNPSAKLSAEQVEEIRSKLATGCTIRQLAKEYGVTATAVHGIKSGRRWSGKQGSNGYAAQPLDAPRVEVKPGPKVSFGDSRSKVHCMTSADASSVRELRRQGQTLKEIAVRYSVSETHVSKICQGAVWPDGSEPIRMNKGLKMTPEKIAELKGLRAQGWTVKKLAEHFGVDRSLIFGFYRAPRPA